MGPAVKYNMAIAKLSGFVIMITITETCFHCYNIEENELDRALKEFFSIHLFGALQNTEPFSDN